MNAQKINLFSCQVLRFYARCFSYPYAELQYELQHLFRVMENMEISLEEGEHLEAVLNIVNQYQAQEIKNIREDFVQIFTPGSSEKPYCPLWAGEFLARMKKIYDPEPLLDLFVENGISVEIGEPFDSIINYLEYLSLLFEQYLNHEIDVQPIDKFINLHVLTWVPHFCNQVSKISNLDLYRETAVGLRNYLHWLIT
jgi:TorA maturation chaperone TorD